MDEKLHIPEPGPQARYEILRTRYLGLADSGIISRTDKTIEEELLDFDYLMDGLGIPFLLGRGMLRPFQNSLLPESTMKC